MRSHSLFDATLQHMFHCSQNLHRICIDQVTEKSAKNKTHTKVRNFTRFKVFKTTLQIYKSTKRAHPKTGPGRTARTVATYCTCSFLTYRFGRKSLVILSRGGSRKFLTRGLTFPTRGLNCGLVFRVL